MIRSFIVKSEQMGACAQTQFHPVRVPGASDFFFHPSFITTASTTRDSKIITTRSFSLIFVSLRGPKRPPAGSSGRPNTERRRTQTAGGFGQVGKGTQAHPQRLPSHSMQKACYMMYDPAGPGTRRGSLTAMSKPPERFAEGTVPTEKKKDCNHSSCVEVLKAPTA